MNPRRVKDFLTSKFGLFVMFVVALFSGMWVYGRHQAKQQQAARLAAQRSAKVEVGQMKLPLSHGLEDGVPQRAGTNETEKHGGGKIVPFRPPAPVVAPAKAVIEHGTKAAEKPRKVRYQTLIASYVTPVAAAQPSNAPPKRFVPYGTLLKCKLVNTVDSANLETPVIALLLEDVWQNGARVIPANTLVHGTARPGRLRDRVTAVGTWRLVWQDGRELTFPGMALDREFDHGIDGYAITDGSAGLRGRLIASDDLQELKILASAALSGFARGTQDRTQTAFGSTITGSLSAGVREGAGEVFELYAQRTLKDIEQNGYFVRVPAGKEFYVYVAEAVDPQKAKAAGTKIESTPTELPAPPAPAAESESKPKG